MGRRWEWRIRTAGREISLQVRVKTLEYRQTWKSDILGWIQGQSGWEYCCWLLAPSFMRIDRRVGVEGERERGWERKGGWDSVSERVTKASFRAQAGGKWENATSMCWTMAAARLTLKFHCALGLLKVWHRAMGHHCNWINSQWPIFTGEASWWTNYIPKKCSGQQITIKK